MSEFIIENTALNQAVEQKLDLLQPQKKGSLLSRVIRFLTRETKQNPNTKVMEGLQEIVSNEIDELYFKAMSGDPISKADFNRLQQDLTAISFKLNEKTSEINTLGKLNLGPLTLTNEDVRHLKAIEMAISFQKEEQPTKTSNEEPSTGNLPQGTESAGKTGIINQTLQFAKDHPIATAGIVGMVIVGTSIAVYGLLNGDGEEAPESLPMIDMTNQTPVDTLITGITNIEVDPDAVPYDLHAEEAKALAAEMAKPTLYIPQHAWDTAKRYNLLRYRIVDQPTEDLQFYGAVDCHGNYKTYAICPRMTLEKLEEQYGQPSVCKEERSQLGNAIHVFSQLAQGKFFN